MRSILFFLMVFSCSVFAQDQHDVGKLKNSISFAIGSENNVGNLGFMLVNDFQYRLGSHISTSVRLGLFHSIKSKEWEDDFSSYSCAAAGLYLHHNNWFNQRRNFVSIAAGLNYVHANQLIAQDYNVQFGRYGRADAETISKLGLGLSLEGGQSFQKRFY